MNSIMGKRIAIAVVLLVVGVVIGFLVLGNSDSEPASQQGEGNNNTEQESTGSNGENTNQGTTTIATVEEYATYCSVLNSDTLSSYASWGELVDEVTVHLGTMSDIVPPVEVIDYHTVSLYAWNDILEYAITQPREAAVDESTQKVQEVKDILISISQQIDVNTLNTLSDAGCIAAITF